jgi:hypothetical protein
MLTNQLDRLVRSAERKLRGYGQVQEEWIGVGAHLHEPTCDCGVAPRRNGNDGSR